MSEFYNKEAFDVQGKNISMDEYKGKTVLVVNTASKCGFTPQYEGLQQLYEKYKDKGLEILGFPCDQFGHQEPGTEEEIYKFCSVNFGVTFPLFRKIEVNGSGTHPIYKYLKKELPGTIGPAIKWNFTKFLIGPDGKPLKRFAPMTEPGKLENFIEPLLKG